MDEMELLRKLGAAAGGQTPVRVNVIAQVMAAVHERQTPRDGMLWWAAGISSALAACVAVLAVQMYVAYSEPLGQFVSSLDTVLQ